MIYVNVIPFATHSNPGEYGSGGAMWPTGQANAYDGDPNTYYYGHYEKGGSGDFGAYIYCVSQHTWSTPITIQKVYYKTYNNTDASGNYPHGDRSTNIELCINGTWTSIYSSSGSTNSGATSTGQEQAGPWNLVTGMRAAVYSYTGGDRSGHADSYIYELKAYREGLVEVARVESATGAIRIGGRTALSTDKVRVYQGSTVMGIPLVDPGDIQASPIRFHNGSAVKCFALAD